MAFKWYNKAAEQGNAVAQFNLGLMYEKGQGLPQDYVKAHMWYNIASQSNEFAIKEIANISKEHVEEKMTPIQITKAQKLASQCYAKKFKGC